MSIHPASWRASRGKSSVWSSVETRAYPIRAISSPFLCCVQEDDARGCDSHRFGDELMHTCGAAWIPTNRSPDKVKVSPAHEGYLLCPVRSVCHQESNKCISGHVFPFVQDLVIHYLLGDKKRHRFAMAL